MLFVEFEAIVELDIIKSAELKIPPPPLPDELDITAELFTFKKVLTAA